MGLFDFFRKKRDEDPGPRLEMHELARRLGVEVRYLVSLPIEYRTFRIPKRRRGTRTIHAPSPDLKTLQRAINRRLLARLAAHPAAIGFERGHSIATNALHHVGRSVIVRMDIRDFFPQTATKRVNRYFRFIGWDRAAAARLTELTTHEGGLPQGAPTSPRLANLLNVRLDARMSRLAARNGAVYTRYADDLTFSSDATDDRSVNSLIRAAKGNVEAEGYRLHMKRKLHIRRRHQQQRVTGLVVNAGVHLPRETRKRLRAIEHHLLTGRPATLTPDQLAGWRALQHMIRTQTGV